MAEETIQSTVARSRGIAPSQVREGVKEGEKSPKLDMASTKKVALGWRERTRAPTWCVVVGW